jgi:hypothetical protein
MDILWLVAAIAFFGGSGLTIHLLAALDSEK